MATIADRARDVRLFGSRFLIIYDEKGVTICRILVQSVFIALLLIFLLTCVHKRSSFFNFNF